MNEFSFGFPDLGFVPMVEFAKLSREIKCNTKSTNDV